MKPHSQLDFRVVVFLVIALLKGPLLASSLAMGMGLLASGPALDSMAARNTFVMSDRSVKWLERAVWTFPENGRARWYLGVAHFWRGDEQEAAEHWLPDLPYSEDAHALGQRALTLGDVDAALIWFAVSSNFDNAAGDRSLIALSRLCQSQYAFMSTQLPRSRSICAQYWLGANGNILINGQFDQGKAGWMDLTAKDESSSVYVIDETVGWPAPSIRITGKTNDYHGGWFQSVSLLPGTTLDYRVRIRAQEINDLIVEVLVWQAGDTEGNLTYFSGSRDWTLFENSVTIPDNADQSVIFVPVRMWGKGTIWLDDVSLTISEGKER